jgi:phosphoribosyl 1,2-cyclic phosphate phosphodiesterase
MKLTFLGSGTSCGVPQIGCKCHVCTSTDPRDNRLRASALIETDSGASLLIDCGPDFRQQMLTAGSPRLDALLLTHTHYDHTGGIDDLRPYCPAHPGGFPVFCRADVAADLRDKLPYCFAKNLYPGVPTFNITEVKDSEPFTATGVEVTPLPVFHREDYPIIGFRIGPLAYVTDAKILPESTLELMQGVDTLVINALRYEKHYSHLTVDEALAVVERIKPHRTYFTHMSHHIGRHCTVEASLPPTVRLAYDGLTIQIPSTD